MLEAWGPISFCIHFKASSWQPDVAQPSLIEVHQRSINILAYMKLDYYTTGLHTHKYLDCLKHHGPAWLPSYQLISTSSFFVSVLTRLPSYLSTSSCFVSVLMVVVTCIRPLCTFIASLMPAF